MKLRECLPELLLVLFAIGTGIYVIAGIIVTIGHVGFSNLYEPVPFLATWHAWFIGVTLLIAVIVASVIRLFFVGRDAVSEYQRASDAEKAFMRRVATAIFRRVRRSDGAWGKRAKAAHAFYRDVVD